MSMKLQLLAQFSVSTWYVSKVYSYEPGVHTFPVVVSFLELLLFAGSGRLRPTSSG
jgi:hypothetical protein